MTRILSLNSFGLLSITSLGLALSAGACSSDSPPGSSGGTGATGGSTSGSAGQAPGTGGSTGATGGSTGATGGSTGATGGSTGATGGSSGTTGSGATGGTAAGGSAGTGSGATGGTGTGGTGAGGMGAGGGAGMSVGGSAGSGAAGMAGSAGSGSTGGPPASLPAVVTSTNAMWAAGTLTDSTGTANVTVNDTAPAQKWDGFGGAFNELGWKVLTSAQMQADAIKLLFSDTDGAAFAWGRIPIGASDYAASRYTEDDTGDDVTAMSGDSNRPAADTALAKFSTTRDGMYLIPYIKAAQMVNPKLRFWASPWTPPVWMKTGYDTSDGNGGTVKKASYYDGGSYKNDATFLTAYAQYYTKWVQAYQAQNINVEIVSPQNEPGYEQNYPSCLWDSATYVSWVGKYLGPAMKAINVSVMLGTLSNAGDGGKDDTQIATAVLNDATAKTFLTVAGAQWGVLDKVVAGTKFGTLPIWATEHKCGNYPWMTSTYNKTQAPNDQAYGVESWGYIRDAITKGKVTAYNAWNMVLDKVGLGIDTSRDWRQDALLVADSGKVNPTQAYYVFRHFSQYVVPGATVVGTTGGDAVGFKNPDGSIVAVMYNSGAANNAYVVALGGKKVQFSMPAAGWATVIVRP